jgi:hypothetical protein
MVKAQNKVEFIEIKSIETESITMTVKGLLGITPPPKQTYITSRYQSQRTKSLNKGEGGPGNW